MQCVVRLGLEPRLFWTKTRRVASYTMGHYLYEDANLEQNFVCTNILLKLIILKFARRKFYLSSETTKLTQHGEF